MIAEGTPEEVANHPDVIEAYLGDPELAQQLMDQAH
jgi:branched-chain amino acid transport system ATP-binding protein